MNDHIPIQTQEEIDREWELLQNEVIAKEKELKKKKRWRFIAVILLIAIIILILLLLRQCTGGPVLSPDYAPQEVELNATPIEGDDKTKLEHSEGGGAVSLQFRDAVTIDLSDNKMYLSFANPGRSTQDMLLQVTIQDEIIAQSGRLLPGYEVAELELLTGAGRMLQEGIYDGLFVITYYDPETNERAMVNTDSPVKITVQP